MIRKSSLVLVCALVIVSAYGASAASASDVSVGVFGGPSFANNNLGTKAVFGVDGTYLLGPNVNLGIRVGYEHIFSQSATILGDTIDSSSNMLLTLAQANYVFDGQIKGLSAGVLLGLGNTFNSTTGASSTSSSSFTYGPKVAYDYPVANSLTVGADLSFLIVSGQSGNPGTNLFNTLVTAKYWF